MAYFTKKIDIRIRQEEYDKLEKIINHNPELGTLSHAVRVAVIQFISGYDFGGNKFDKAAQKLEEYKRQKQEVG